MKLHGVRPAVAVAVFAAAVLAACGGGGGGGGSTGGPPPVNFTPTPAPTSTPPPGVNFVKGVSGVAQIPPNAPNTFSSSMLGASTDGTFVIQSADTPARPTGSSFTLTEYNVTATESAAGVTSSTTKARASSAVSRDTASALLPFRPRLDPRTAALQFHGRSTMSVAHGRSVQAVRSTRATVGDARVFHIRQGTITGVGGTCTPPQQLGGTDCYLNVPTHLLAQTAHASVWVDDAIDQSYGFSQASWNATATTFETDYARETVAFAPAFNARLTPAATYQQCDGNGAAVSPDNYQPTPDLSGANDQHIGIVVTKALENSGEGGYFDVLNLLNDQEWNCAYNGSAHVPSNNLPMFVIGADKYGSSNTANENYWRTQDMPRSLPHEFQHYLHALNKALAPDFAPGCPSGGCGVLDDAFIDEGDSMLAEDLVLGPGANPPQSPDSQTLAFEYLYTPGNFSLTAFAGYDIDPLSQNATTYGFFRSTAGNYGGAYLLARYLYDRFGGDSALHRVYADLTHPIPNTANVNPLQSEANGEPFTQFYSEFAEALAARGVATGGDARFQFSSNVLLRGLTTIQVPSGATWNMRFNGPRSPEDLSTPTSPSGARIKLTPGASVTIKLITGATLFPNVAPAGGAVVSGSVSGAPALGVNAALVQGAYDDSGSCLGPPANCS